MNIFEDNFSQGKLTKKFIINRIVEIEQSIVDSHMDQGKVSNITISNLELNRRILQQIEDKSTH